jgi:hypothetical protein
MGPEKAKKWLVVKLVINNLELGAGSLLFGRYESIFSLLTQDTVAGAGGPNARVLSTTR